MGNSQAGFNPSSASCEVALESVAVTAGQTLRGYAIVNVMEEVRIDQVC